jgi:glycosyltransferase involved in cell wall biosynthesis
MNVPPDAFLAGYFGFMNASKGIEAMVDSAEMAVADGLNLHLAMIGGRVGDSDPTNVKYAEQIDNLIGGLTLGTRLHWTGFISEAEVSAHLLACDFLILPYNDGASFRRGSFMAGLAHGCAIITTSPAVELPELHDGVNVRLVPPGSPLALRRAIESLCDNEPLRLTLQQNARALSEQFTWERIARQTLDYFEDIRAGIAAGEPGPAPVATNDPDL